MESTAPSVVLHASPPLPQVGRVAPAIRGSSRVESLDYLRGVLALGVMLYHYRLWNGMTGGYPTEQLFQRIGVYAVCTFYILSGTSLGIVYSNRQVDRGFLLEFVVKRFFRIAPLFWVATTLTIALRWYIIPAQGLSGGGVPPHHGLLALLNYSLLFGWLRPDLYIAGGSWSIGNELVFYSLFPGLLVLMRHSRAALAVTFSVLLSIGMLFAFVMINGHGDFNDEQWRLYINPFNHAFLFAAGIALALLFNSRPGPSLKRLVPGIILCLALFVFWPGQGKGELDIVTGHQRLLFSGLACAFCYFALVWHRGFGRFAGAMVWIGNISYSVYLLHPILFSLFDSLNAKLFHASPGFISFGLALPATIVCAMLSWKFMEKPLMRTGRRLVDRLQNAPAISQNQSVPHGVLCNGR